MVARDANPFGEASGTVTGPELAVSDLDRVQVRAVERDVLVGLTALVSDPSHTPREHIGRAPVGAYRGGHRDAGAYAAVEFSGVQVVHPLQHDVVAPGGCLPQGGLVHMHGKVPGLRWVDEPV